MVMGPTGIGGEMPLGDPFKNDVNDLLQQIGWRIEELVYDKHFDDLEADASELRGLAEKLKEIVEKNGKHSPAAQKLIELADKVKEMSENLEDIYYDLSMGRGDPHELLDKAGRIIQALPGFLKEMQEAAKNL